MTNMVHNPSKWLFFLINATSVDYQVLGQFLENTYTLPVLQEGKDIG